MNKKEIADRVRLFGETKYNKIKDFANALEMTNSNLQQYLSGRVSPGANILIKLQELGCDINWLLTGLGSNPSEKLQQETMTYKNQEKPAAEKESESSDFSQEEIDIIKKIRITRSKQQIDEILSLKIQTINAIYKFINFESDISQESVDVSKK